MTAPPTPAGTFDYIVVGAGSAGCAIAARLSENGAHTVLLLESGASDKDFLIRMPRGVGRMNTPADPRVWHYRVSPGGNRPQEDWLKGRALGGSSSINGTVYVRGAPADFDGWARAGCTGWGWAQIEPCFLALEDHALGAGDGRGVGGPLKISVHPPGNAFIDALIAAAGQMGVPHARDVNDARTAAHGGIGYQPRTIHRGQRFNAVRAFLDPARGRKNLVIRSRVNVLRVTFDGTRATGVVARDAAGDHIFTARRDIILSAGALETPRLLQLSGVGPAQLLTSLGIDVVADRPQVGQNLIEHRYLAMQHRVAHGSTNRDLRGPRLLRSLLAYQLFGRGVLTHSVFEATAFVKSDPSLAAPDGQIGIGLYSMRPAAGFGTPRYEVDPLPGISIGAYKLRPDSRGSLRLSSSNFADPPIIDANYLAEDSDRRSSVALVRFIRTLMRQPAMAALKIEELTPGAACDSDDAIIDAFLTMGNPGYHVAGTCRMGADDTAVTDPHLRVRGVQNLRIADLSITPTMISGNTNAAAMVIGLRAAQLVMGETA